MENKAIMSVDYKHYFDSLSDEVTFSTRVCLDIPSIRGGLIKAVGANRIGILLAIVGCMDKEGKAFPSQRKLAELTGQSANTVNKLINELLEIEFNGQKILRREMVGVGARKKSVYYINQSATTNTDELDVETKKVSAPLNSKDYALMFAEKFEEKYGQGYVINYGRDLTLIKNKLIPNFDQETLTQIIDIAIKDYATRWANAKYPTPTISMLATWLGNQISGEIMQERKDKEAQVARVETAEVQDESDKFLEAFGGE